jgi:HK97 gp10 family phage protein
MPSIPASGVSDLDLAEVIAALGRLEVNLDKRLRMALGQVAGEVATHAKQNHEYRDRTGKLTASIRPDTVRGTFASTMSVDMLAGGRGQAGGVFYASHVEFGTKPHVIRPKRKKALAFFGGTSKVLGGGGANMVRRKVNHPGNRPFRFMRNALEAKLPRAEQLIDSAFQLAIDESGLE